MEHVNAIEARNIEKKYKNFTLDIPELNIPKGFATALIGENGAGKTTLLNILTGIRLDYKGSLKFFEKYTDEDREKSDVVKDRIGYTGTGNYYFPQWTVKNIEEINEILFSSFDKEKFLANCEDIAVFAGGQVRENLKVSEMSDGMKTKVMIASVLARDTDILIMDEPASPLDPLMRDKLCRLIGEYIENGNGEKSVFFSTHNISDMESVTDYAIIMEHGQVVESGFVEDLKEKYILVKGEKSDAEAVRPFMFSMVENSQGFEGCILSENLDKVSGIDLLKETPTLSQICVAVMRANTRIR